MATLLLCYHTPWSSIVVWRYQQISEHHKLIICELLFMVLPVVMVSTSEIRQRLLNSQLYGLWVIKMVGEVHEYLRYELWYIIREGLDTGAQAQHTSMALYHQLRLDRLYLALLLLDLSAAQLLETALKDNKNTH
jgi:hypothetical protein